MAFVTTETAVVQQGGYNPPIIKVYGTYTNSGGGTGGLIVPGYTNSSGTLTAITGAASIGARKIIACVIQTSTEDVTTAKAAAPAYSSTYDADTVTITTAANSTGFYVIDAYDNGA